MTFSCFFSLFRLVGIEQDHSGQYRVVLRPCLADADAHNNKMPIQIVRFIVSSVFIVRGRQPCANGSWPSVPPPHCCGRASGRHIVPHVIEGIVSYAQVEQVSFRLKAESLSFNAHRVLLRSAPVSIFSLPPLATASFQECEDRYQFRCRLDIEVVHALMEAMMPCGLFLMALPSFP